MMKFWLFGGFRIELFKDNFSAFDGRWSSWKHDCKSQK